MQCKARALSPDGGSRNCLFVSTGEEMDQLCQCGRVSEPWPLLQGEETGNEINNHPDTSHLHRRNPPC